jgi:hypothetical protein
MGRCTMFFKCIRQRAMLSLFFGIVHSSDVTDYNFNIKYEKRIAGHSTNIAIPAVPSILQCAIDCVSQHMCCSASFDSNTGSCSLNSHCSPQWEQYSDFLIITKMLSEGKSFNLHWHNQKKLSMTSRYLCWYFLNIKYCPKIYNLFLRILVL